MLGWAGRLAERADLGVNVKVGFRVQKERWQNLEAALHGNGLALGPRQTGLCAQEHKYFSEEKTTAAIGSVTSGSPAPSVGCPVVMMRITGTHKISAGDVVWADVRGRRIALTICVMPFFAHRFKR